MPVLVCPCSPRRRPERRGLSLGWTRKAGGPGPSLASRLRRPEEVETNGSKGLRFLATRVSCESVEPPGPLSDSVGEIRQGLNRQFDRERVLAYRGGLPSGVGSTANGCHTPGGRYA